MAFNQSQLRHTSVTYGVQYARFAPKSYQLINLILVLLILASLEYWRIAQLEILRLGTQIACLDLDR